MKELTIAVPAFNDQASLPELVNEIFSIKNILPSFHLLIINDGSSDNTLRVAQALARQFPEVTVISHPRNLGFGPTIAEVVQIPETEWIAFLPGDHQFPAKVILDFWEHHDTHDFILGNRKDRNDSLRRKLNSKLYNTMLRLYTGINFKDVNSVFLCRSALFEGVQFMSRSAFIHAEIALTATKYPARVVVVDITHRPRKFGSGSGGKLRVILATISDFCRYIYQNLKCNTGR
jgi:dolichol-phosphate mannosyltransferase